VKNVTDVLMPELSQGAEFSEYSLDS